MPPQPRSGTRQTNGGQVKPDPTMLLCYVPDLVFTLIRDAPLKKNPRTEINRSGDFPFLSSRSKQGTSRPRRLHLLFRQVFWLSDYPTNRAFPVPKCNAHRESVVIGRLAVKTKRPQLWRLPVAFQLIISEYQQPACGVCPRIQRRARPRFIRGSLLSYMSTWTNILGIKAMLSRSQTDQRQSWV